MNKLQRCYFMFWMSLIFLTFFSVNNYAQLFSIKTHIPSEAAGEEGVAVKIIPPPMSRFPEGAPVVVYVEGGIGGEGISGKGVNLELRGFVELLFNFPGGVALPKTKTGGFMICRNRIMLYAI